jgi:hypothetical protein
VFAGAVDGEAPTREFGNCPRISRQTMFKTAPAQENTLGPAFAVQTDSFGLHQMRRFLSVPALTGRLEETDFSLLTERFGVVSIGCGLSHEAVPIQLEGRCGACVSIAGERTAAGGRSEFARKEYDAQP